MRFEDSRRSHVTLIGIVDAHSAADADATWGSAHSVRS
jgi:hypothetical protein